MPADWLWEMLESTSQGLKINFIYKKKRLGLPKNVNQAGL